MDSSRPLPYNVLITIFSHMIMEQRVEVAEHCPTVKSTERSAELKLENLSFGYDAGIILPTICHFLDETQTLEKLVNVCLSGRKFVKVDIMYCGDSINYEALLPAGLRIECQSLEILQEDTENVMMAMRRIRPFLVNLPLANLTITTKDEENKSRVEEQLEKETIIEARTVKIKSRIY